MKNTVQLSAELFTSSQLIFLKLSFIRHFLEILHNVGGGGTGRTKALNLDDQNLKPNFLSI